MGMVDSIEDYIADALVDVSALDDVQVFIKGGLSPSIMVPQDKYPFSEVMCARAVNYGELTGNYYEDRYIGIVTFSVLLTQQANADWLDTGRIIELASYVQVRTLVHAAIDELRKTEHRDLGELTTDSGVVTRFGITEPTYGYDVDVRTNNWMNWGSIPFEVETEEGDYS